MAQQRFLALRREVDDLVAFQIHALTQGFALNSTQLHDCHVRFERIMDLQEEVAGFEGKHRGKQLWPGDQEFQPLPLDYYCCL